MEKGDPPPSYNSVVQGELRRRIKPNNKTDDADSGETGELERPASVILSSQINNTNENTNTFVAQESDKQTGPVSQIGTDTTNPMTDPNTSNKPSAPPASMISSTVKNTNQPEINEKLDHTCIVNNPNQSASNSTTTELIETQRLNLWERFRKGLEDFAFFVIQLLD